MAFHLNCALHRAKRADVTEEALAPGGRIKNLRARRERLVQKPHVLLQNESVRRVLREAKRSLFA